MASALVLAGLSSSALAVDTSWFVRGEVGRSRENVDVSNFGSAPYTGVGNFSDTSTNPYFGAGLGYDFSQSFGLSLNYDHQKGDSQDISITANTLTLGGEFRF